MRELRSSTYYLVYIIIFGLIPFVSTFAIVGDDPKAIVQVFSSVPVDIVIYNTLIFSFFTALFSSILGLLLAVMVDMLHKGKRLISLLIMLPYTIPFTSSALIWGISLYGKYGWFSYFLHLPYDILYFSSTSIWGVTLVSIWSSIPMAFLILLSAIRGIPKEMREVSAIDNMPLSKFYGEIALPFLGKAFWLSFLLEFVLAMGNFDLPYVLTSGGPGFSSTTLPLLVFDEMFDYGNFPGGAFASIILGAISTIPAIALLFLLVRKTNKVKLLPSLKLNIPDKVFKSLIYVISSFLIFFLVFPVYWMFLVSLRSASLDFRSPPVLLPVSLDDHYLISSFISAIPYLVTSIVVAILASTFTVFLSLPAGYETAQGTWRWILPLSIYIYSLPSTSYVIPLFLMFEHSGLLNNWLSLILSFPIFTATFGVWVFYNFFIDFPRGYNDAAEVFSIKRKMWRIVIPLSKSSTFSVFLLSFIFSWHMLFYPLIFSSSPYNFSFPPQGSETVTIFALLALGDESVNWGILASSALVAALPVMIVTVFAIDRILKGSAEGGIKFI
ncbi:ABC transporter permease subunit [Candidatus Acidianus copahuensis]|uniref:ABC transporter permease n=1 Tax=Candidatus Acidianus copahuensis TaxID=1160895 RepID=UPI00064F1993|nr:ABC transporter permease subunit [Candidatus Acidianus copahuensis]